MSRVSVPMGLREAKALYDKAHKAGMEASAAITPTPMRVVQHAQPFNPLSAVVKDYGVINEGACGFGWVEIRPSRGGFATFCKKKGIGRYSEYSRCWMISSPLMTQSYERNVTYASAFSAVLREAGIDAFGNGRMD